MSTEGEVPKSCKDCFCKPVCLHFHNIVGSFRDATRNMTGEMLDVASDAVSIPLAKKCKTFSSVDERDFNRLQSENKDFNELINSLKRKLN